VSEGPPGGLGEGYRIPREWLDELERLRAPVGDEGPDDEDLNMSGSLNPPLGEPPVGSGSGEPGPDWERYPPAESREDFHAQLSRAMDRARAQSTGGIHSARRSSELTGQPDISVDPVSSSSEQGVSPTPQAPQTLMTPVAPKPGDAVFPSAESRSAHLPQRSGFRSATSPSRPRETLRPGEARPGEGLNWRQQDEARQLLQRLPTLIHAYVSPRSQQSSESARGMLVGVENEVVGVGAAERAGDKLVWFDYPDDKGGSLVRQLREFVEPFRGAVERFKEREAQEQAEIAAREQREAEAAAAVRVARHKREMKPAQEAEIERQAQQTPKDNAKVNRNLDEQRRAEAIIQEEQGRAQTPSEEERRRQTLRFLLDQVNAILALTPGLEKLPGQVAVKQRLALQTELAQVRKEALEIGLVVADRIRPNHYVPIVDTMSALSADRDLLASGDEGRLLDGFASRLNAASAELGAGDPGGVDESYIMPGAATPDFISPELRAIESASGAQEPAAQSGEQEHDPLEDLTATLDRIAREAEDLLPLMLGPQAERAHDTLRVELATIRDEALAAGFVQVDPNRPGHYMPILSVGLRDPNASFSPEDQRLADFAARLNEAVEALEPAVHAAIPVGPETAAAEQAAAAVSVIVARALAANPNFAAFDPEDSRGQWSAAQLGELTEYAWTFDELNALGEDIRARSHGEITITGEGDDREYITERPDAQVLLNIWVDRWEQLDILGRVFNAGDMAADSQAGEREIEQALADAKQRGYLSAKGAVIAEHREYGERLLQVAEESRHLLEQRRPPKPVQ
jgi:hypothetical protein